MKEKEFREKMAGLYGMVPSDTHAAFEHALTHHREKEARTVRVSKVRFAVLVTLIVMLLATGAYAVYTRYSVTDYMRNSSQAFMEHVITLNETYQNDLFTMTVNDLVFDGSTFAVAMNIDRRSEDIVYYMRTKVTATCAGKDYMVDVEGWRGPDFLAGGMWPELTSLDSVEEEGFGFEGVLWDWDMNPPPAGQPIDWTMTFNVFRPLWEIEVDNDIIREPDFDNALETRCMEAYRNRKIFMYSGDVNSYILTLANEMELWNLPWEDMLVATGAFELADVITFHFTTDFDDDIVKEELVGQRYDMGEYAIVLDSVEASFQRVSVQSHLDFGRDLTLEELKAIRMPSVTVTCVGKDGTVSEPHQASSGGGLTLTDTEDQYGYRFGFDAYLDASNAAALIVEGYRFDDDKREFVPAEDFKFTIELP